MINEFWSFSFSFFLFSSPEGRFEGLMYSRQAPAGEF